MPTGLTIPVAGFTTSSANATITLEPLTHQPMRNAGVPLVDRNAFGRRLNSTVGFVAGETLAQAFALEGARSIQSRVALTQLIDDDEDGQRERDGGREQAVLAEVLDDEGLHVEQPERRRAHQGDEQGEQFAC